MDQNLSEDVLLDMAMRTITEYTGWQNWTHLGLDETDDAFSCLVMREPYQFGHNYIIQLSKADHSIKIYPGK